ncbi:MAG: hypothetical protein ACRDBY_06330 [Cetobacterium sp.]
MSRRWSKEELEFLKENYNIKSISNIAIEIRRSYNAVRLKASEVGIKKDNWTDEEIEYLCKSWGKTSVKTIAKNLNKTVAGVNIKGYRMFGSRAEFQGYYTCTELAKALNLNKSTIIGYCKQGLKSKKVDRFRFINLENFWDFAKKNKNKIQFYKFDKNQLLNEPAWVSKERAKQLKHLEINHYKEWTNLEDKKLINLAKKGKSTKQIAKEMDRTITSIQTRRQLLNVQFILRLEEKVNAI